MSKEKDVNRDILQKRYGKRGGFLGEEYTDEELTEISRVELYLKHLVLTKNSINTQFKYNFHPEKFIELGWPCMKEEECDVSEFKVDKSSINNRFKNNSFTDYGYKAKYKKWYWRLFKQTSFYISRVVKYSKNKIRNTKKRLSCLKKLFRK